MKSWKSENTMSTELVAIERIEIRKGDSNADDIRSRNRSDCLDSKLIL